ncbi:MAG: type IV secretion system protein [Alphaproteobacteria bacterium]
MTRRLAIAAAILVAAAVLVGTSGAVTQGWHGTAAAQSNSDSVPPAQQAPDHLGNAQKGCRQYPDAAGGTLIGYIIPCIAHTIADTTSQLCQKMVDMIMPIVWAFITLVLIFFGIKVLSGEGQVHSEGFLLLIKIGVVVAVLQTLPNFIPYIYSIMTETVSVVSGTISQGDPQLWQDNGDGTDPSTASSATSATSANGPVHCDVSKYGDANTLPLWKGFDCMLGKLWGITMGTNTAADGPGATGGHPSMLLAASVVGTMSGFLFGGTFGVILFIACIGVVWTLFMVILRTAFAFINSYLYASILLLIAPLFLPLTLLRAGNDYFQNWTRSFLACFLLPLVITAYAMLAIQLYDGILFAPNAEINKLFNMEGNPDMQNLIKAEKPSRRACDMQTAGSGAQGRSAISGIAEKVLYQNRWLQSFTHPGSGAFGNLCGMANVPVLVAHDIDTKKNYATDRQAFEAMIKDCVKLFLVSWLVSQGFKNVQGFVSQIVGSSAVATSFTKPSAMEARFETGMAWAKQGMIGGLKDKDGHETMGPAFLRNIPTALGDAAGVSGDKHYPGFFGGIGADPGG